MEQSGSISEAAEVPETLAGKRLDAAAAKLFPDYSRARLQAWIQVGRLRVNGEAVSRTRMAVAAGDHIELDPEPLTEDSGAQRAQAIDLDILHEDADLAVLNKPAGLTVHPGAGVADGTLQNALLYRYPESVDLPRAGIIHRLDKHTSGVMVVARSLRAHTHLVRMMQAREIQRAYEAIVWGRMVSGGTVDAPIGRDPRSRTRMAINDAGREAVTHYRIQQRFAWHTRLAVQLETGRTHQIRVHMRHIQHPIVGDDAYGGRRGHGRGIPEALRDHLAAFPRQALHARRLQFAHPANGEELDFSAPLPRDLVELLEALAHYAPDRGA